MENNFYQQRIKQVLGETDLSENGKYLHEKIDIHLEDSYKGQLKIVYNEKLKKFVLINGKEIFTTDQINVEQLNAIMKEINVFSEVYNFSSSARRIDPNVWNLLRAYDKKYSTNNALVYMKSMNSIGVGDKLPIKIIYEIKNKKPNIFDKSTKIVYEHMEKLKRLNVSLENKNISITNLNTVKEQKKAKIKEYKKNSKNSKLEEFASSNSEYMPMVKNKKDRLFKRIGMSALAFFAGFSFGGNLSKNQNDDVKELIERVSFTEFSDDNNFEESTAIKDDIESIKNEFGDINQNEFGYQGFDISNKNEKNDNIDKSNTHDVEIREEINIGDKIEILSDDAKYYIDSQGSGYGYSFSELKNEYQFKDIYAEYITEDGVIHGVGVTENNEEIHFGWLGKDTVIKKVKDITNEKDVNEYER